MELKLRLTGSTSIQFSPKNQFDLKYVSMNIWRTNQGIRFQKVQEFRDLENLSILKKKIFCMQRKIVQMCRSIEIRMRISILTSDSDSAPESDFE